MTSRKASIEFAKSLDRNDPLGHFRDRFLIANPKLLYLDGNSLGRMPLAAANLAEEIVQRQWAERLIRGWSEGWISAPERVGGRIARIIGAEPDEVIVADSTSVNLFKTAVAALKYQSSRTEIVTDNLNFPSDLYVLQGIVDLLGNHQKIHLIESKNDIYGPEDEIIHQMNSDTALVTLSHVVFKSGFLYDMEKISKAAKRAGVLTLWDLSHSVGAVPIDLKKSGVDLAVGCTYKYLNGGPGSPAFIFIRKELQKELKNPISGWMGSERMFEFNPNYKPDESIKKFLTGTPSVLGLALVEPGVNLLIEAGIDRVRKKSIEQVDYLVSQFSSKLEHLGFKLNSPIESELRGSHISISHLEGLRINKALIDKMDVIPDFRVPDNIRFGIAPLYTRFQDLYVMVERIKQVVERELYLEYNLETPFVT